MDSAGPIASSHLTLLLKIILETSALSWLSEGLLLKNVLKTLINYADHRLFNPNTLHCRGFKVLHSIHLGLLFPSLLCYQSLLFPVNFIGYKYFLNSQLCVLTDWLHPVFNTIKRVLISHVIHYDNSVGLFVKRSRHSSEPVLTCSVPDLYLVFHLVFYVFFYHKVQSYCCYVILIYFPVFVMFYYWSFTYEPVSQ